MVSSIKRVNGGVYMQSDEMRAWVECSLEFHGREEGFARLLKKHASAQQILHSCGIKDRHETAERILAVCKKLGISIITQADACFPESFYASSAPIVFYAKGDTDILTYKKTTGVIGARKAADSSLRICSDITGKLAKKGVVIVSGFAQGIDRCAHTSCISCGGKTVAVLGCGIGYDYPKGSLELEEKIAQSGAVISEYPPLVPPKREYFRRRNRLIAALSSKLLVVEASDKSGCLNTAGHALQQGKDIFVIPPADIRSQRFQGQVGLIRDGAAIAFEAEDIY